MSICPLPSGLEPGGLSKTGSNPPATETQLCCPTWADGRGDGGGGLTPMVLPLGGSILGCAAGFACSPPSFLPKYFGPNHLSFLFLHPLG